MEETHDRTILWAFVLKKIRMHRNVVLHLLCYKHVGRHVMIVVVSCLLFLSWRRRRRKKKKVSFSCFVYKQVVTDCNALLKFFSFPHRPGFTLTSSFHFFSFFLVCCAEKLKKVILFPFCIFWIILFSHIFHWCLLVRCLSLRSTTTPHRPQHYPLTNA